MKLLADVNVDRMIVAGLRTDGHEVEWLAEDRMGRRMPDDAVIRLASRQGRIVLTYNTDFARYIFTDRLPSHGVVLLRVGLQKTPRAQRNQRALEALRAYQDTLLGQFTTIYLDHIEQQPLPSSPTSPKLWSIGKPGSGQRRRIAGNPLPRPAATLRTWGRLSPSPEGLPPFEEAATNQEQEWDDGEDRIGHGRCVLAQNKRLS